MLRGGPCLQNYGNVETQEGRLLAFPNAFYHRVSPFELEDKTKPGHRHFIVPWLVDLFVRITSIANVPPPQQQVWWLDHAFGRLSKENDEKVPQAVAQLINERAPGHPGLEAAEKGGRQTLPPKLMSMVEESVSTSLEEAKKQPSELDGREGCLPG